MKDQFVNLNSLAIRLAVSWVISDTVKVNIPETEIWFGRTSTKHGLWIKNKFVFYYDKHLHWPLKKQHVYAIHEFLRSVERTCSTYAPVKKLLLKKQLQKVSQKRNVIGQSYKRVLKSLQQGPVERATVLFQNKQSLGYSKRTARKNECNQILVL